MSAEPTTELPEEVNIYSLLSKPTKDLTPEERKLICDRLRSKRELFVKKAVKDTVKPSNPGWTGEKAEKPEKVAKEPPPPTTDLLAMLKAKKGKPNAETE